MQIWSVYNTCKCLLISQMLNKKQLFMIFSFYNCSHLNNNQLSGQIPLALSQLTQLLHLWVHCIFIDVVLFYRMSMLSVFAVKRYFEKLNLQAVAQQQLLRVYSTRNFKSPKPKSFVSSLFLQVLLCNNSQIGLQLMNCVDLPLLKDS